MRYLLILILLLTATHGMAAADDGFDRYAVILSKRPFGVAQEPVAPPAEPELPAPPADDLRLCSLTEREGRGIQAGVVEKNTNRSYVLGIGETVENVTLVSADLEREEAVLRRGGQTLLVKLAAGSEPRKSAAQQAVAAAQGARSGAIARNVRSGPSAPPATGARRAPPPPAPQPKYTGEALREHLREYNMEAIRQGLPALPIELTPEQDDQLVMEGVLPPSQDSFSTAEDPLLLEAVEKELQQLGFEP